MIACPHATSSIDATLEFAVPSFSPIAEVSRSIDFWLALPIGCYAPTLAENETGGTAEDDRLSAIAVGGVMTSARCRLLLAAACLACACCVCTPGTAVAAGSGQSPREVVPAAPGSGGGLSGGEALAAEEARATGGASAGSGSTASAGVSLAAGGIGSESGSVLGGANGLGNPMGFLLFGSEPAPSVAMTAGSPEAPKGTVAGPLTNLNASAAALADREAFPAQIAQPAGGPPSLPAGDRIVRFVSDRAAQLALADGMQGVVESSEPMAVESSLGHYASVDLGLQRSGGVFESARPLVGVVIPAHASEGVQLPEAGVSLTPVDAQGGSLGGAEGAIDGASVVYASTQADADTLVRPTLSGVETSTILRAADSPSTVYFRVGLPAGARLVQSPAGKGPVRVVQGARAIAVVRPPGAVDAAGDTVPTSMNASGDLLAVSVAAHDGGYRWPIDVDPELAYDEAFGERQCHQKGEAERQSSNWCWSTNSNFKAYWYTHAVEMWNEGAVSAGAYTAMSYKTQGASKIYEVEGYTDGTATKSEAKVEFARKRSGEEGELEVPAFQIVRNGYKSFTNNQFCVSSGCPDTAGSNENLVAYKVEAYEPLGETYNIDFSVQNTKVYIAQEKGPEASLNTTEEHPQNDPSRVNVAYTHGWLSPSSGAFEYIIHDPGIGVSEAGIQEMGGGNIHLKVPIYEEGKCNGVQCNETYRSAMTYSTAMADGEDKFELWGRDKAGFFGYTGFYESEKSTVIKVDGTKPYNLGFTGMREEGAEVSAAQHTLTVHATDGTAPVPSSGVKSLAVSVDGGAETVVSGASCPLGPCTASGTYTLAGEDLSEGVHRLVVTTIDNAGNIAAREVTFDVRHGSPVPVGPGTVDPTTGQLKLSAADVSLAGSGGVSRVFQSRDLTAGTGGPLGQQWALSLGGGQGLTVLPNQSVVLASASGGTTTFYHNEKGELESPPGDENIKLEAKEKEYLLKDVKAGTTTVFTQPVGTEKTMPVFANQFGQEGAKLGNAVSAATDASGNVWVTDYSNDRILKFSPAGVLLNLYGWEGYGPLGFRDPWGIAVNKVTGNVYVSDPGNNRVEELNSSGGFVRAFGWGVSPGGTRKNEFQDCTEYCEAGIAGSGAGQFNWPVGVAVDSSGNVWVAESNNQRIQEFNAEGKYLATYGSAGTGGGQFNGPLNIAFVGSNLFVTDELNNRVQELSNTGAFVKAIGWGVSNGEEKLQVCTSGCRAGNAGSGKGQFYTPVGLSADSAGDLYVVDYHDDRVQELTSEGAYLTQFGTAGSGNGQLLEPYGVAVGPQGQIYVAEYANKRIQEWMRAAWLPSRTEGSLKNISSAYAYTLVEVEGKVVIQPTEALAATPAGIVCVGSHGEVEPQYLKDGCRALTFNYAESTTAKGEGAGEWGDYKGNLTRVYLQAWNPKPKEGAPRMESVPVAHYLFDGKDRLRAVWDPRIEPEPEKCVKEPLAHGCLVTTYGYDEKGRVTALTPPHQESWALTYGTIPRDGESGRLVKATRAPASAKVWAGESLTNSEGPRLSGTPVVGVRMAVSDGKWSGGAIVYGYQWEDCNAGGAECSAIAGATNPNYTLRSTDVGHTLVAKVTATNGAGSVVLATSASAVASSTWQEHSASKTQLLDGASSINAVSCVPNTTECVVGDSKGNAFYATNVSATGAASWKAWSGPGTSPSEALACPSSGLCLMAAGEDSGYGGNLYYATSLGGSWTLAYSPAYGVDTISCPSSSFCADGQDGGGYFRWATSPTSSSWNLQSQGSAAMKGAFCLSISFCAIADSKGSVHVATSETQVKSSSWTETNVDGTTALNGIACTSTSSCVAVDSAGNVLNLTISGTGAVTVSKQDVDGTNSLTAIACAGGSTCVVVDTQGNVFVSNDSGNTWKKQFTPGGNLTSVSCASTSLCVTASTAGNVTSFDPTLTQPLDETSPLNAVSCIPGGTTCVVSDGKGNAYYATNVSAGGAASWHSWTGPGIGPSEAVDCPSTGLCLLAAGEDSGYGGNLYYATSLGGAWTQAYSPVYGVDAISCPSSSFCADGQDGGGYFRWSATPASTAWELESQGTAAMKAAFCLSSSFCAIADSVGSVHVATTETQVKSSSWTQTSVDGSTALNGIACTSTTSCVAVDNTGNVLNLTVASNGAVTASKQDIDGSTSLTAVTCMGASTCAAVDGSGNVFVSTNAGASWSREYQLSNHLTSVSCASSSLCATVDTAGRVTAFNPTSATKGSSYTQSVDGGSTLNAVSCVPGTTDCVLGDGKGNAFYATNVSTSTTPSWKIWAGPGAGSSRALGCPASSLCVMAAGTGLYYATALGGPWTQGYGPFPWDAISCSSTSFCVAGEANVSYVAYSSSPASTSWKERSVGSGSGSIPGIDCLSSSFCAAVDSTGHLRVTTTGPEGTWTETDIDGSTPLRGIACTSTSSCVAVDGKGNIVKLAIAANGTASASTQDVDGTNSLNAVSCSGSACAAVDAKGSVLTSTDGGETWNGQYTPGGTLTSVSCASASLCVTVSSQGEATAFNPSGVATEAAQRSPQPGTTIEYGVPVSGEGAPQKLSSEEVEKWGQKDLPTEATAIFPPDEPQGWPASGYKRATITYIDEKARTVNAVTPSGAIATTEYNEANEVKRTLTPANRAAAMAEGCVSLAKKECKSAEAAEKLDTQTEYNEEDNQIVKVLGPEHKVKLSTGAEVQARAVTHNYYNEGAEEAEIKNNEEYNLLTKTVSGARLANGEEKDNRTTLTFYNGESDLGWKLRKPTSTTVDPTGLDLTTSTTYDPNTGEVINTQTPNANKEAESVQKSFSSFGGQGTGAGQLSAPTGVATDSSGNVWVADTGHSRVQEFNAKGEFVQEFGAEGSGNGAFKGPRAITVDSKGDIWVADTGNDRVQEFNSTGEFVKAFATGEYAAPEGVTVDAEGHVWVVEEEGLLGTPPRVHEFSSEGVSLLTFGAKGTGNGQFKSPRAIAVDSKGFVWVADTGNNRVQEFKPTGEWVRAFGLEGTGNGQFKKPTGVAIDHEGDVWVADSGNNRIQRFTSEGSYLSQVGTTGNENDQFSKPEGVATATSGSVWVADTANNRVQELTGSEFVLKFGGSGSGAGQLEKPAAVATDSAGNAWVADTGHSRVQEFNAKGEFVREFGAEGSGNGAFKGPRAITVDGKGNVWVADTGNDRIQEFNAKGEFIRAVATGEYAAPEGIAADGEGHVWVVEEEGALGTSPPRVHEFSSEGVSLLTFGKKGAGNGEFKGPRGIALDSKGYVWVADTGNNRVQEFKPTGEWVRAFGSEGTGNGQFKQPTGVAFDHEGDVWVADSGNNRIQRFNPEGGYLSQVGTTGNENDQFSKPEGVATDSTGNVWVADTANNRVQELKGTEFVLKLGGSGSGAGQLEKPAAVATDSSGNIWVADTGHSRVQEFNAKGEFVREFGAEGTGNGSFKGPRAIAVDGKSNVWVADTGNDRIQEFNSKDEFVRAIATGEYAAPEGIAVDAEGHVWVVEEEGLLGTPPRVHEFSSEGVSLLTFGTKGIGSGQFKSPHGIAVDSKGYVWVADSGNNRVQEFKPNGEWVRAFGAEGMDTGQFNKPTALSFDSEGDVWVADSGNNRIQRFNSEGGYLSQIGTTGNENGQFSKPEGVATSSTGATVAVDTANNRVQVWTPEHRFAHDGDIVYYTPGAEARVPACQNHPEWANLTCQVERAAQPLDVSKGQPALPVTKMTYNIWDEVETTTEAFGSVTRTKTQTYDVAGRALTSEETATGSSDKEIPKVTNEYSAETGALEKQTATIKGEVKTTTSKQNTLGQLIEYTDAEGNVVKYTYEGNDGRLERVSEGKGKEAESYQTYSYDPTTGFMTTLVDSAAHTFTASYDIEGRMTSEVYPNGMCANTAYSATGQAVSIEYIKTRNCSESKPTVWFSDMSVPSIHGETLEQVSTLAKESYAYDSVGRLSEAQETPTGKGCTARLYGYDEESNRTSLTTRQSGTETCAKEGGTVGQHAYDEANRLVDTGVEYEALGNTTKLPAADAGEHEIKSTYYVDNQVATQEQNKTLDSYVYDPAGRAMEMASENTETKAKTTTISHYAGAGEAVMWTSEGTEKWTRNIPGIDGSLCAVQTSTTEPELQLHDLQGNIVATAKLSESATELASKYNSTEFGVPSEGKTPPKYAWLGAGGLATETAFGTGVATQGGASYVPQVARNLQTAPVMSPGAFPNGQGTGEQYGSEIPGWYISLSATESANTLAEWTAEQEAKRKEAEAAYAGTSVDPWGLLTGKEALEFAEEFNKWALAIENYQKYACKSAECDTAAEADIKSDKWMAKGLEECYRQVHNPSHIKYHGKTYEITKVCLLHLNYKTNYANWVFAEGSSQLFVGESLPFDGSGPSPWGNHGSQEWLFEVDGKEQWWVFGSKRGWWRSVQ
jgi:YD repeat-containing protein